MMFTVSVLYSSPPIACNNPSDQVNGKKLLDTFASLGIFLASADQIKENLDVDLTEELFGSDSTEGVIQRGNYFLFVERTSKSLTGFSILAPYIMNDEGDGEFSGDSAGFSEAANALFLLRPADVLDLFGMPQQTWVSQSHEYISYYYYIIVAVTLSNTSNPAPARAWRVTFNFKGQRLFQVSGRLIANDRIPDIEGRGIHFANASG